MKSKKTVAQIPGKKLSEVKTLSELVKNKKTMLVASIKNIPASQFQEIGKKLRGKAIIKVPKKSLMLRAIEHSKNPELQKVEKNIEADFAVLFSDLDSYELAAELLKNRSPAKAKPGQIAPMNIEIPDGPTELVPGPAISELGALGIQIQIEKGKIHIKQAKVIVKEGEKIKQAAAEIMAKLDIKPFSIGFIPLFSFDTEENTLYTELKIDSEAVIAELKEAFARALSFAVEMGYVNSETLKVMIRRASAQERKLNRIMSGEPEEEVVAAPVAEEKKEEVKPQEEKKESSAAGLASLF